MPKSPRTLPKSQTVFRLGDGAGQYPVFSAEGARRVDGRWHQAGDLVIYAAAYQSTALLEKLVYLGAMPPNQHMVEIDLPSGLSYEVVTETTVPGWYEKNCSKSREFGHRWFFEQRSCLLFVPSVVARKDQNLLINTLHPDFAKIEVSLEEPVRWDGRLFE